MSTSLSAITNANITSLSGKKALNDLLKKLKALNMKHCWDSETRAPETGEWTYRYMWYDQPLSTEYNGPFAVIPNVFSKCTHIHTIYNYYWIYRNYDMFHFRNLRQEVFNMVQALGGTEIIWLSDQTNVLWRYEEMVYENHSYQEIKAAIAQELGSPITNYRDMDYASLDYQNITCWVLDDFEDLKEGEDQYKDVEPMPFG